MTKTQAEVEADLTLKDTMAAQRIPALKMWSQSANFFKTRKLLFFVVGVYPGTRYSDLCLSGVTIHYAKGIDYTPTRSWKKLRILIEDNRKKTLYGWNWLGFYSKKYPNAFNDFLYYIVTGNKEAYALFRTYAPGGAMPSEDMDNFFRDAVKQSLSATGKSNRIPGSERAGFWDKYKNSARLRLTWPSATAANR